MFSPSWPVWRAVEAPRKLACEEGNRLESVSRGPRVRRVTSASPTSTSSSSSPPYFSVAPADDHVGVTAPLPPPLLLPPLPRLWKTARVHSLNSSGDGTIVRPASLTRRVLFVALWRKIKDQKTSTRHPQVSSLMTQLKLSACLFACDDGSRWLSRRDGGVRRVQVDVQKFADMRDFGGVVTC